MKRRRKAYLKSWTALVLTLALTLNNFGGSLEALASRNTLDRIEDLAKEHTAESSTSAWQILEIVPEATVSIDADPGKGIEAANLPMGSIGYLIGGQEPYKKLSRSERRNMITYLRDKKALDSITGDGKPLKDDGPYREYLEDMIEDSASVNEMTEISKDQVVSFDSIVMNHTPSGNYVKIYHELSGNTVSSAKAMAFLTKNDNSSFEKSGGGDFQPLFTQDEKDSDRYRVKFAPIDTSKASSLKYGYVVKEAKAIGKAGETLDDEYKDRLGEYVYTKGEDGVYTFAGTLSVNEATISVNSIKAAANEVTTTDTEVSLSPNMAQADLSAAVNSSVSPGDAGAPPASSEGDSGKKDNTENTDGQEKEEGTDGNANSEKKESNGNTGNSESTGGTGSITGNENPKKLGNEVTQAPGDSSSDENSEKNISKEEGAAGSQEEEENESEETSTVMRISAESDGKLYLLSFNYIEDSSNSEQLYHVTDWEVSKNGAWYLDSSRGLVPDVSGEGPVKEKDSEAEYIVYQFDKGNGVYSPAISEGASLLHEMGAKVYYGGGWRNNDWFKQYVFDRTEDEEYKNLNIEVVTKAASDVKLEDIENARFVFLAAQGNYFLGGIGGSSYKSGERDISYAVAEELLRRASEEDKNTPILVENAILSGGDSIMKNLANALCCSNYSAALTQFMSVSGSSAVSADKLVDSDSTFVNLRVYMFKNLFDNAQRAVNNDFNTSISSDGFTDVSKYISYENNQRKTADRVEVYISEATAIRHIIAYDQRIIKGIYRVLEIEPEDMTAFLKINSGYGDTQLEYCLKVEKQKVDSTEQHVLKYKYKSFSSNSTSNSTSYDEEYTLFATRGDIVLTQMSVQEFIGHIEDLNATYDMIFIGGNPNGKCSEYMYDTKKTNKASYFEPWYRDISLNGLVYMSTGDKFPSKTDVNKLKYKYSPGYKSKDSRFSGADILKTDIDRIKEFAKSELPIVIDDKLLNADKKEADSKRVEKKSYMYTLINDLRKYYKKNVYALSEVAKDNTSLLEHLEVPRPEVKLRRVNGQEISDGGRVVDATTGDGGLFETVIEFRIEDEMGDDDTRYTAEFYLDRNADGQYADSERDDAAAEFSHDRTDLSNDTTYKITRKYNDNQYGVVPWRIVIYQNGNDAKKLRRSDITGYSRIIRSERPKIKILQLHDSGVKGASTLNMEQEYNNGKDKKDKKTLGRYLYDADHVMYFDLDITTIRSDEFIDGTAGTSSRINEIDTYINSIKGAKNSKKIPEVDDYYNVLCQYDLIVCGFGDWYMFGYPVNDSRCDEYHKKRLDRACNALLEYVKAGRSLLLSHDCVIAYAFGDAPFSEYLFDIVGMNRFGFKGETAEKAEIDRFYASDDYDEPGDEDTTYGPTYLQMIRSSYRGEGNAPGYNLTIGPWGGDGQSCKYYAITQVNEGQITKYPYDLGNEPFPVTCTHSQDFQLNLNIDKDKDKKRDLVVWYCLGEGYKEDAKTPWDDQDERRRYSNTTNDVRNNYFIYNMRNITYTGQGHKGGGATADSLAECSDMEAKLFINTLVAAYSAGVHAPDLTIHAGPEYNSQEKSTEILPFDTGLTEESFSSGGDAKYTYVDINAYPDNGDGFKQTVEEGPYLTMYFKPTELNVNVESSKTEVAFFVDDKDGTEVSGIGTGTKVSQITPLRVERIVADPTTYKETSRVTMGRSEVENSFGGSSYALDSTDGRTMYAMTFKLEDIVRRQKDKTNEKNLSFSAIDNLPAVHVVLHTHAVKFTIAYDNYNSKELKFARAQLFMLE